MRKLIPAFLTGVLLFIGIAGRSQTSDQKQRLRELQNRLIQMTDSFTNSPENKSLRAAYADILRQSPSYTAVGLFYEVSRADISALNTDLAAHGMKPLSEVFHGMGFALTRKNNKVPTHFLITAVLGNKSSDAGHYVRLSTTGISIDKGYAVIDTKNFMLHPFVGVGTQIHTLKVVEKNPAQPVNDLFDISQGDQSGTISQDSYYAILGAQLSYNMHTGNELRGIQFALRFAYNPVFARGKYQYRGETSDYRPRITPREYNITLMTNLFSRTAFHLRPFLGGE